MHWSRIPFLIYKVLISPVLHLLAGLGLGCRYEPSCSQYMAEAVKTHGLTKGFPMGIRRLLRCHPFSSTPYHDPVVRKTNSSL
ncbi:MAG: membrane protein insertion efficiency factor YidD [Bdellovibrionia bacterium]